MSSFQPLSGDPSTHMTHADTASSSNSSSRSTSAGRSRWFDICHNHAVNRCHTAIGTTGGPSGSPGSDYPIPKSVPQSVAKAVGSGADARLALSKSEVQPRLRAAVRNERSTHLCSNESPHGPEVGRNLSFQTVSSNRWGGRVLPCGTGDRSNCFRWRCPFHESRK